MAITLRTQIAILCTFALTIVPKPAVADEGGVSFWIPTSFEYTTFR